MWSTYCSVALSLLLLGLRPVAALQSGYANPELVVETEWLASASNVSIVDARSADAYAAGHIPGAVHIPRNATIDSDAALRVVGPSEQIAELFGRQGIDEKDRVVVYDDGVQTAAARVFWTLEYYGHRDVSVLNGGFTKWKAEARAISRKAVSPEPVVFVVGVIEDALSTKAEMLAELDDASVIMVDSRAPTEYIGEAVHSERGGHIPAAVNVEWTRNFTDGEVRVFKSAAELNAMYVREGVTRDKRVHTY